MKHIAASPRRVSSGTETSVGAVPHQAIELPAASLRHVPSGGDSGTETPVGAAPPSTSNDAGALSPGADDERPHPPPLETGKPPVLRASQTQNLAVSDLPNRFDDLQSALADSAPDLFDDLQIALDYYGERGYGGAPGAGMSVAERTLAAVSRLDDEFGTIHDVVAALDSMATAVDSLSEDAEMIKANVAASGAEQSAAVASLRTEVADLRNEFSGLSDLLAAMASDVSSLVRLLEGAARVRD